MLKHPYTTFSSSLQCLFATVGLWVSGSNMRPGGVAVSVICDTRDTCPLRALFVWPLHLFLALHSNRSRSELHCFFFSQSVSQLRLQSLQFRDLSAIQSGIRLSLLPAYLSLESNAFLRLFASSSLAEDGRISRPVCQQLSRGRLTHFWACLSAAFSMEIDTYLDLFASRSVCQQISLQINVFLGLFC